MKKNFYKCDECGQKFGRKWNASRHSQLVHGATSNIIRNDIKPRTLYLSHNRYYNYERRFKILYKAHIEVHNKYHRDLPDIFDLNIKDFKIIKIIDQLIKPFNELEELLIHVDEETRAFILLESFEISLKSHNPVSWMNEMVELLRSINGIKKIAMYKSLIADTPSDFISDVKAEIKSSLIFQRQNN